MISQPDRLQQIKEVLELELQKQDRDAKITVQRASLGWLHLHVVTSIFNNKTLMDREETIDTILADIHLNLGEYPFNNYELQTPEEAILEGTPSPVQTPLWSEILMAPEPIEVVPLEEDTNKRPFIVTFYSFKGGVGRSTALAFVATILANQKRRVVMIDFDLEAPGLSFMFPSEQNDTIKYGVLDYLYQRYILPDTNEPKIAECIRQIDISTRGELYLVPAGVNDENYIHRLADLNIPLLYQQEINPLHQLLDDVKDYLDPDIILIDARTGFTEMGSVALLDQADLGILCFTPTKQSFAGLEWVVKAANKKRDYAGIPDLRFLLTPIPAVASSQQKSWLADTTEWISNHWMLPQATLMDEIYYQIPYNPVITTLTNFSNITYPGLLETYTPIVTAITASLPEKRPLFTGPVDIRHKILAELNFNTVPAQEIAKESISAIFQPTEDFTKIMQERVWLVRGVKGSGKTLLFRLFTEIPHYVREMEYLDTDLSKAQCIVGHGKPDLRPTLLTNVELHIYKEATRANLYGVFWINYMLLQLVSSLPTLQNLSLDPHLIKLSAQKDVSRTDIVTWLINRTKTERPDNQAIDEAQMINNWLQNHHQKIWLFYDELDRSLEQNYIHALISVWEQMGITWKNIIPKIILREDIWDNLDITNSSFSSRSVLLHWEEADLWRLALRQALNSSPAFTGILSENIDVGKFLRRLETIEITSLRTSLFPLWGEHMGRGSKMYTFDWILHRIRDGNGNYFPGSLLQLLQSAIHYEKSYPDRNPSGAILRPQALIDALPSISEHRVAEIRNEYPELIDPLDKLANEYSPIAFDKLKTIWGKSGVDLQQLAGEMIDIGILQEYPRTDAGELRYSIADLYRYGLKVKQRGQK